LTRTRVEVVPLVAGAAPVVVRGPVVGLAWREKGGGRGRGEGRGEGQGEDRAREREAGEKRKSTATSQHAQSGVKTGSIKMLGHTTSLWHQDARTHDIIVLLTATPAGPAQNPLKPCSLCSHSASVRDCGRHPASPASCCVLPDPVPARRHSLHAVGPGCSLPPRSQLGALTW
jgi:hypothetical protein